MNEMGAKRVGIGIFPNFNDSISKVSDSDDERKINGTKFKIVEESSSESE